MSAAFEKELNQEAVYKQFYSFDFDSNKGYQNGLVEVLKQYLMLQSESNLEIRKDLHQEIFDFEKIKQEDKVQLVNQAKVFFFCTQTGNILDFDDYEKWVKNYNKPEPIKESTGAPPYSSNYEELLDLIVNNKPIPGIKQVPDTVLDPALASKNSLAARKKPWEKDEEVTEIKDQSEVKVEREEEQPRVEA